MAKEALAAFEATLKKEPNRLGAYVGAAKAAEKSGDNAKARQYSEKIVAIAGGADKARAEVADARAFLEYALRACGDRQGARRESIFPADRAGCYLRRRPAPSRFRCSAMPACSASGS